MTYSELLQTVEWRRKRSEIIIRDQRKCQNCYNETYQRDFNSGLLLRIDRVIKDGEKIKTPNGTYIIDIDDYKNNETIHTFLSKEAEFDFTKDYIIFYEKRNEYYNIHAMKLIESKIIFNTKLKPESYMTFGPGIEIKFDIRKMISEVSFLEIYKKIEKYDKWDYIIGLHVHHKYYQKNKKPWEYPNDALVALCWSCHENLHRNQKVPYLDDTEKQIGSLTPCFRCFGAGWFPEFNHIQNGVCFRCNGAKYEDLLPC